MADDAAFNLQLAWAQQFHPPSPGVMAWFASIHPNSFVLRNAPRNANGAADVYGEITVGFGSDFTISTSDLDATPFVSVSIAVGFGAGNISGGSLEGVFGIGGWESLEGITAGGEFDLGGRARRFGITGLGFQRPLNADGLFADGTQVFFKVSKGEPSAGVEEVVTIVFAGPSVQEIVNYLWTGDTDEAGKIIVDKLEQFSSRAEYCFAAGTMILMADRSTKNVADIAVGDKVVAFRVGDAADGLEPRRVTQTHINTAEHLLDVAGLKVTPGHVFLCGDGPNNGQFEPLIDIILRDGALVKEDGALVRPSIDAPVGSEADRTVQVLYTTDPDADPKPAMLRAGTRLFMPDGETTIAEILAGQGYRLTEDGLVARPGEEPEPLNWFGIPPRPEDYILAKSGLTLDELYHEVDGVTRLKAGEPVH